MRPSESRYEWECRTCVPDIDKYRRWISTQFESMPEDEHKCDVRRRFTNKRNEQHFGAAFELFLYGMFREIGYSVAIPGQLPGSSRLDFVLSLGGTEVVNLEGTVVEVEVERDVNTQHKRIYSLLEAAAPHVRNKGFKIRVTDYRCGSQDISARKSFAPFLDEWFSEHSVQELDELLAANAPLPTRIFEDTEKGWRISMELCPRKNDATRIWHCIKYPTRNVPIQERLRKAIKAKLSQHQPKLDVSTIPYIIAISIRDDTVDLTNDVMDSVLAGTVREQDGIWTRPNRDGSKRTQPAAVLCVENCFAGRMSRLSTALWENPHVDEVRRLAGWPFRKCGWPPPDYRFLEKEGASPLNILGLM